MLRRMQKVSSVTCLGYYSHAKELTHGMIYLAGDNVTPTQVIRDTVDIAYNTNQLWQNDYSMIQSLTVPLGALDFTGGKKLQDAIDEAVKYGNAAIKPRPMYFAWWDHRHLRRCLELVPFEMSFLEHRLADG